MIVPKPLLSENGKKFLFGPLVFFHATTRQVKCKKLSDQIFFFKS